jgi:uncharacterized protein
VVFIWTAFVTGLLAGGASCAAVQGGLLAGLAARRAGQSQSQAPAKAPSAAQISVSARSGSKSSPSQAVPDNTATAKRPHSAAPVPPNVESRSSVRGDAQTVGLFLVGKLAAYTLLGFALGLVGKAIAITPQVQAIILIIAGSIMLVMALDLFGVKAVRRLVPSPPASWTRRVRTEAKGTGHFAPLSLGAATVLLPCGVTISMEVAAIATGSPLLGAGIMAAFVIGTVPLFFTIGFAAHRLTGAWGGRLAAVTGTVVLIAGLVSINSGLNLSGSSITLASIAGLGEDQVAGTATTANGGQQIVVEASSGYSPNTITAKAGVATNLVVHSVNAAGCIRSFTIPSLNVNEVIPENGETTIPLGVLKAGRIAFACGMGMYTGTITVTA